MIDHISPIVTINLYDVISAGGVEQAIQDAIPEEYGAATADAMDGQTFATSGPGCGRTKQFSASDYAAAWIAYDASQSGCDPEDSGAIDPEDGRIARGVSGDDGEFSGDVKWSDESVVCVECPDIDDAEGNWAIVAEMAKAVRDYHGDYSPVNKWADLIREIKNAVEAFADLDPDDFNKD